MKFTITNNGTKPFVVRYTDMYKIYDTSMDSDEGPPWDTVELEPDTSITLDNVDTVEEIEEIEIDDDTLTDASDLENEGFGLEDIHLEDEDEEDKVELSQEDFDLNERHL